TKTISVLLITFRKLCINDQLIIIEVFATGKQDREELIVIILQDQISLLDRHYISPLHALHIPLLAIIDERFSKEWCPFRYGITSRHSSHTICLSLRSQQYIISNATADKL